MTGVFLSLFNCKAALGIGLVLQGAAPTVGDTIWVGRTVGVPAGHTVRAAEWEPPEPVQLLGRARVLVSGDSVEIAYPVVIWRPGRHIVDLPGPLVLGPGGTVDSLTDQRVPVEVRSVLPAASRDSVVSPQPRASLVQRRVVSIAPMAILWLATLVLLVPLHLWWRRRGTPTRGARLEIPPEALEAPLARWADAGEHRAVANVATAQLRAALAERVPAAHPGLDTERVMAELAATRPEWPLEDLGAVLRSLDDVRFGVAPSAEALGLSRSSTELRNRILRGAA
jgi:hypothetical protein